MLIGLWMWGGERKGRGGGKWEGGCGKEITHISRGSHFIFIMLPPSGYQGTHHTVQYMYTQLHSASPPVFWIRRFFLSDSDSTFLNVRIRKLLRNC